jgi:phosphoribosylanthranilate isomerase
VQKILNYPASAVLIDAFDPHLYGGTGRTADWEAAREVARLRNVFLAGGLSPGNIREAIRIVEPYAVDLNSGVESAPGRKDPVKLREVKQIILREEGGEERGGEW